MTDFYQSMLSNSIGRKLAKALGLPIPAPIRRHQDTPAIAKSVLYQACNEQCQLFDHIRTMLDPLGTELFTDATPAQPYFDAIIFDASEMVSSAELSSLHAFFSSILKRISRAGRVVVLSQPYLQASSSSQAAAFRGLHGFVRSLAKELGRKGVTVQLLEVEKGAQAGLAAPLQFILSPKSAYVDGQSLAISHQEKQYDFDLAQPLQGKRTLITGASRGIGKAIAEVMARDGALLTLLDIAPMQDELEQLAKKLNAEVIVADITATESAEVIAAHFSPGGVDIIVHNAGITRDKMLSRMPEQWWEQALDVNLRAMEFINDRLLSANTINENGRIICVSSMNGIAGQVGQTNYSTSKAGVIGYVEYTALQLPKGITINAVAPGFIETAMTDAIPFMTRQFGRHMNSLSQGGQPVDVAETIAMFAAPHANGLNGQVLRVCGQCVIGA